MAIDTSAETRKLEGKLDAIVNLVTQLAANQKHASVARVCNIRSSNDHHTSVCPSSQQSGFHAKNDSFVIRGVHDVATYTSAKIRKLEGKLDALVNLVTQLAVNQKPASVARVFDIRSSNDHPISVSAETSLLIEKLAPNSWQFIAWDDAIVIRGVYYVATDTSAETRNLEGKLDALVNFVTQLAMNQKAASVARVCGIRSSNDHHTGVCHSSQQSGVDEHPEAYASNAYSRPPQLRRQGVHDVATDTSAETRKLEGRLDALVNLVTQLSANQKPASIARLCDTRSSNDNHTSVCPSSQQSGVDEHPEAYAFSARNDAIVIRGVHDVALDTSAETRKLERKLDVLVSLVTQPVANQKHASVAKTTTLAETRHMTEKMDPNSCQFSARNYAIVIRGVHDVATNTSPETRRLEGKLDALVNLVTQPAANQKPASVARVFGIYSSNDHHTSVCPSSQQSGVDEHPEAYAANTYSRPPNQQR
ncbi:hypothetical protein Fmac_028606 [Flemingia macrophylla]|uniref:Uncharacterized protein n=1 Tax=Flemingia macrophylla TaxID=520843 RepID=A0ABD1L7Z6_9FABA